MSASTQEPTARDLSLLGSLKRTGRWQLAPRNRFVAVFGSVELDLTQAELPPEAELSIWSTIGSVDVLVPTAAHVSVSGGQLLGGKNVDLPGEAATDGAPAVRIRVRGLLGSLDVRRGPG